MLRRKVEDLETENERLQKEIRSVLSKTDTRITKVCRYIKFSYLKVHIW